MVKVEELEQKLKTEDLRSFYLFYGEETYLIENIVKKIKKKFGECTTGINYILLDDTNVSNLLSELEAPPFGYTSKLILVKNAGLFKKETKRKNVKNSDLSETIKKYMEANKETLDGSYHVIFIEEEAEKNGLFQWIDKEGVVCCFEKLTPASLTKRLKAICDAYHVQVDIPTLTYLVEMIGTNMQDAINEIRKLIEYVGEKGTIQKEHIDKLCMKQTETVIFELTDKLGNKDAKGAIETLRELIYQKEPVQKILTLIYHHFKKLYFTKLSIKENKNLAEALNLKPNQLFLTSKYKKQAAYFEENTLRNLLEELIELDANSKIGRIDLDVGLESILGHYCSEKNV